MIRRYKKKADSFDTLEIDYEKDPNDGSEIINKISVLDNTTGKPRIIGYINRINPEETVYKIEVWSKGHDVEAGYEGPTAVYNYSLDTDPSAKYELSCNFSYLRSNTKKYVEGIVKIDTETEDIIVASAKLYDLDCINVTDIISYDEVREIYTLNQYENDGEDNYRLIMSGEYDKHRVERGTFRIYDLITSNVLVEINTTLRDTLEVLM